MRRSLLDCQRGEDRNSLTSRATVPQPEPKPMYELSSQATVTCFFLKRSDRRPSGIYTSHKTGPHDKV